MLSSDRAEARVLSKTLYGISVGRSDIGVSFTPTTSVLSYRWIIVTQLTRKYRKHFSSLQQRPDGKKHLVNKPCLFWTSYRVKVKCTFIEALKLCTGRTFHRGSRGIALLFLDHGTRRGWGVSVTPRPLFTAGKDPVPILVETGWGPGPVWTGAENLAPTGIPSPDRPARSQSLYRLLWASYCHIINVGQNPKFLNTKVVAHIQRASSFED